VTVDAGDREVLGGMAAGRRHGALSERRWFQRRTVYQAELEMVDWVRSKANRHARRSAEGRRADSGGISLEMDEFHIHSATYPQRLT
jgi:hypothetical protein